MLLNYYANHMNDFLKKLEEKYPEKLVSLMGIEYDDEQLSTYIKENLLTEDTFDSSKFKEYLEHNIGNQTISLNKPPNPSIGAIFFDTTTNILKCYDGNQWIEISTTNNTNTFTTYNHNQFGVS